MCVPYMHVSCSTPMPVASSYYVLLSMIKIGSSYTYNFTANKWVVNILSEEIGGRVIGLFKLCVVTICHKTSTFNIYGFYTGKNSLTWQRDGIKRSGCIESLVFLEVDETCRGGPGLLWMECPVSQSVKLQKHIHE